MDMDNNFLAFMVCPGGAFHSLSVLYCSDVLRASPGLPRKHEVRRFNGEHLGLLRYKWALSQHDVHRYHNHP